MDTLRKPLDMLAKPRLAVLQTGLLLSLSCLLSACGGSDGGANPRTYYQTKTPYAPQQDATSYEAPPSGFNAVYTGLLARHGSRGLSSLKYDLAVYNMWKKASDEGALTALGAQLGPDVLKIMKANFVLGYGVSGITTPGYGNETQLGITEHTQLAQRLLSRQSALFESAASAASTNPRKIVVVTSGVDRAVDSGAFFVKSMLATKPALSSLVSYPPAPSPYPEGGTPIAQPDGTNRFLLYFHKLVAKTDKVSNTANPLYSTYQDSQAFQTWLNDSDLAAKQAAILADSAAQTAGRAVLERLFTKAFVDKIAAGTYSFANTGSMTFSSDDGKFTSTLSGDGKTGITDLASGGSLIYELYAIAPAMKAEANVDFTTYLPEDQARYFAYMQDASDFYKMGPSITEKGSVTWKMAQILEDDFFNEVDAIASGKLTNVAKLRFAHAEIVIPFASKMGLKNVLQQQALSTMYTYDNNPWRGEYVSPMAANMQWDVVRNSAGTVLVKMLYNEKETDFKAACDGARYAAGSHYYDYTKLKACYGHVSN